MSSKLNDDVTILLAKASQGDANAQEQLCGVVEGELRAIANKKMAEERSDHTLQATVLIDDVLCRLINATPEDGWQNRTHFYRAAARAMRRLLIDHERGKRAQRRGGNEYSRSLVDINQLQERELQFDLLVLDEALSRLSEIDERQSDIVELHHFGGYSLPEVAHLLSLSVSTIRLEWRTAKAWLFRELTRD